MPDVHLVQFSASVGGQVAFTAYQIITCGTSPPCSLRFILDGSLVIATMVAEEDSQWKASISVWTQTGAYGNARFSRDKAKETTAWKDLLEEASTSIKYVTNSRAQNIILEPQVRLADLLTALNRMKMDLSEHSSLQMRHELRKKQYDPEHLDARKQNRKDKRLKTQGQADIVES